MASPIMRYFTYDHLPEGQIRATSKFFSEIANQLEDSVPDGAEKSTGLRKLLEAKDCFVRAVLPPQ